MIKGTLKPVMKPIRKGQVLDISLSEFGYQDYYAECTYKYIKSKEKYMLSVRLYRYDIEDKMRISNKGIDFQYISGTKETIEENICRVIYEMCVNKHFDDYVERYEYDLVCFDRGNELYEKESIDLKNDEKWL